MAGLRRLTPFHFCTMPSTDHAPTQEQWECCLLQDFFIEIGAAQPLTLRLQSVTGFRHASDFSRAAYSLLFVGPPKPALPQRTYHLHHDGAMGQRDIFLVPLGPKQDGFIYEAIFN